MFKKYILILLLLVLSSCANTDTKTKHDQACFKKQCFFLEVVSEAEDMRRGLQFRASLPQDSGMLFVFPDSDKHSFWMKDTLIPLDIIWIDHSQRVVHIEKNVPPCKVVNCPTYTPLKNAFYVLEISSGMAERIGLKIGDRFDFYL